MVNEEFHSGFFGLTERYTDGLMGPNLLEMFVCLCLCACMCVCVCVCVCLCVYVCLHVCMSVCTCACGLAFKDVWQPVLLCGGGRKVALWVV